MHLLRKLFLQPKIHHRVWASMVIASSLSKPVATGAASLFFLRAITLIDLAL
jgi:hypothetical protein